MRKRLIFKREKETTGAVRYREVDANGDIIKSNADAVVGSLYIRKKELGNERPSYVHVLITTDGDS